MGPTDGSMTYCGWNIDDVVVSYLAPCDVPVLQHQSHVIDDSAGNNNGEINPGETISMPVTLYNNSSIDAHTIQATLSTSCPDINITNASVTYPDIAGHAAMVNNPPNFQFTCSAAAQDGRVVPFVISWTSTDGSGTTGFSEVIVAPVLELDSYTIDDSIGGDDDGIADPDESIVMPLTLMNAGSGSATGISATLSTSSTDVNITSDYTTFPDIAGGGYGTSGGPDLSFDVDPNAVTGTIIPFTLEVVSNEVNATIVFSISIGAKLALVIDDCGCASPGLVATAITPYGYLVTEETAAATDPSTWLNYHLVIFCSGENTDPIPSSLETPLVTFVNAGGRLLIEGGETGYDHQSDTIASTVLHINGWTSDSPGSLHKSSPAHPVATTPHMLPDTLTVGGSGYYQKDELTLAGDADAAFNWDGSANDVGVVVYDDDTSPTNGGQIVFFSFNVEYVENSSLQREHLIINAANWLASTGAIPPTATPTNTPSPTPTRTPTPTPTPTVIPTDVPTEVPTEVPTQVPTMVPTAMPTPEPTAMPDHITIELTLNHDTYYEADTFLLECRFVNPGPAITLEQYIILEVAGLYFFWDSWTMDLDYVLTSLPAYDWHNETILDFTWPAGAGSGEASFWAAFLAPGTIDLVGDLDHITFGWN
ncbi:hypothetical protein JW905_02110, partial [bacterium]|nr:hypothetical protein [candidate division CSSED10-310 bacterium]